MNKFKGVINGTEYTDLEEFKKAISEIDPKKGYSVSVTEEIKDDTEEPKSEPKNIELYPQFDLDELSQKECTESFDKELDQKLEEVVKLSQDLSSESLKKHIFSLQNLLRKYKQDLHNTENTYDSICDRVDRNQIKLEDYNKRIEELQKQIEEDDSRLTTLDNSCGYLEGIVDFYENYISKLGFTPEEKVEVATTEKVRPKSYDVDNLNLIKLIDAIFS